MQAKDLSSSNLTRGKRLKASMTVVATVNSIDVLASFECAETGQKPVRNSVSRT